MTDDEAAWAKRRESDRKYAIEVMQNETGITYGDTFETCIKKLMVWLYGFEKRNEETHERIEARLNDD